MSVRIAEQMEPLPGYRLIEKIGTGGFGEVWKSEAPGGLLKAIKFVRGILVEHESELGTDPGAKQEFKALQRVKALHHPFILSLERVDIVDDRLMIVMELAEKNLMQLLEEYQAQGKPGIPREELLRYMREAAEALDLMNGEYQVQHLDIKPQNLFVMRRHVKVADFGLAKDLDGTHAALTSGITPTYAAPETFDGVVSHYCDQYSLAIVYQELLTGRRPFRGKTAHQLLLQHVSQPPDLSSLPEADRAAVGRALAKEPKGRFPSCRAFIEALPRQAELPDLSALPAPPAGSSDPTLRSPLAPQRHTPESEPNLPRKPAPPAKDPGKTRNLGPKKGGKRPAGKKRSSIVHITAWTCPRCGTPAKAGSLAFCANCGYCSDLEEPLRPANPFGRMLGEVPTWIWVLLTGILCITGVSVLVDHRLPVNSEIRAVWGLAQLGVALAVLVAAQVWAVTLLAGDEGFDLKDLFIFSGRIWLHTVQRLPETRRPVYLLLWGLVLAVCGVCMGDVTYWARTNPSEKISRADVRRSLARLDEEAAREESRTIAVLEDRARQFPPPPTSEKGPSIIQCVAIGYVPTEDGKSFRGVLMATVRDGKLVQTDVISQGFTPENKDDLFRRMQKHEQAAPPPWWRGDTPGPVVWVRATEKTAVVCQVECTRVEKNTGRPVEPRYKGVLGDQP
jgi:serine/threonine protein kinase